MHLIQATKIIKAFFIDKETNFYTNREASYFLFAAPIVPYSIFLTEDNSLVFCFQNKSQTSFVEIEFKDNHKHMRVYEGTSLLTNILNIDSHLIFKALRNFK